jgi:RHS repeat-associated protein
VTTLFGFTARPFDAATGLQNNLNRWYDAETGTRVSEDPIGFAAVDANLYRYVGNEVTVATDPTGLVW